MGMYMVMRRVDATEQARLAADQEYLEYLIYGDDSESQSLEADPRQVDLDKMWHAVHWLLTGTLESTDGLGAALMGGRYVGHDLGYGPARLLEPGEVETVAREFDSVSEADLVARFDSDRMNEAGVYPTIWGEPGILEEDVLPAVRAVMDLYRDAALAREGVLIAVT
jgi:hypothetical protein